MIIDDLLQTSKWIEDIPIKETSSCIWTVILWWWCSFWFQKPLTHLNDLMNECMLLNALMLLNVLK